MTEIATPHNVPTVSPEVAALTEEVMTSYAEPIDFIIQAALDIAPSSVIVVNRKRMHEFETAKVAPDKDAIKTLREAVSVIVGAAVERGYKAGVSSHQGPKEQGEIDG